MTHKKKSKQVLQNLGELASKHGIIQQQIADKLGVRQQTVSQLLTGRFHPTLDTLIKYLDAINALSGEDYSLSDIDYRQNQQ